MNCAAAKHLIHLDAGDDLRTDEVQQLSGHLEHCTECRAYQAGMVSAMNALLSLRDTSSGDSMPELAGHSVWLAVSREITRRNARPAASRRFDMRVAALSVCSLSLALVTIVQSLSSMRESSMSSGFVPSQPVSGVPQMNIGRQPGSPGTRTGEQTPMLEQGMSPMRRDQDTGAF